jgi:tetratricopeptide (TPR) repeat protein
MSESPNPFSWLPASLIEAGLITVQSALGAAQKTVEKISGQTRQPARDVPVDGPGDIDTAVSDFANRVARILRYTPLDVSEIPGASSAIVAAARRAFSYVNLRDPHQLGFPAQLAISVGTLMTQSALRGLAAWEVMGPSRIPLLARDFVEMFTEFPVYIGLEYREAMERARARLVAAPDDNKTRFELGQMLVKCGRYTEAEKELVRVPSNSYFYDAAIYEAAVALYRAGQFESAARASVEALNANPQNERARMWLWLTAQKLGGYPDYATAAHRMEVRAGYDKPKVEFEDIANKIGLDKTAANRGTAIFDYDNDGYLDIAIATAHGGISLFHNNGDGTFTDVSVGSGLDGCVEAFGITVGDYNNDGYADIFVTRFGFYAGHGHLYRNNGNGTFTDVTQQAGLSVWGPGFAASWVDYDNDGLLDLYIPNNMGSLFERKIPNRLFHNNGDGTFTEVTEQSGLGTMWPSIGGAWADYNNDGRQGLFVSNGIGRSQLYRNNGDGTFTDVSQEAGVDGLLFGSPVFWWDYDNDGWLDIFQCSWSDHEDVIYTMRHNEGPPDGSPMRIYHNNRNGTFTQVNRAVGITGCYGTMSANFGDFNNDGLLDLVLGNGSPKMDRVEPPTILENHDGIFHNTTFSSGLPLTGKSHGVNLADLFGDGRLSVIIAAGGAYPADLLTTNVYYPKTLAGNYLNVRLTGIISNRSAIGARVALEAGGRKQFRQVSGGSNFGCLPFEQHFGLAEVTKVEALEVRWPSGLVQRFEDLPINKTLQFTEGQPSWVEVYVKQSIAAKSHH